MKPLFILFQYLIPQHLLSRLVGRLADCRWNWLKNLLIKAFIRAYKVNMSEAVFSEAADFSCFNDFFTRQLQPDARLACAEANVLISPADGAISEFGSIDNDKLLQAKGRHYTLGELLGDANGTAKQFLNGDFITIYLSPKDYHRVHAPTSGKLIESHYIPGKLFSVNESSVSSIPNIFARNERLVTTFETDHGKVALIMVGAMIVAGIKSSWNEEIYKPGAITRDSLTPPPDFDAGDELGQFRLGSTVILLFQPNKVNWLESISAQKVVRLGEKLADF